MMEDPMYVAAEAYADNPLRRSDFITGWLAACRHHVCGGKVVATSDYDPLDFKSSADAVKPIIERERAAENVTSDTMDKTL